MLDNGIQNGLEKLWANDTINSRLILACVSIGNSFQTMIDESLKLSQSTDQQITYLKSQLKHCKNPLQKLNMEREMNRLIREK